MIAMDFLRNRVPSIFSDAPAPHVSQEYKFIPTSRFVEAFLDSGWNIQKAQQVATRGRDPRYAKHMLDLVHRDFDFQKPELGMVQPRVTIINSHDWSSRFSVFVGLMRLICTNGMMANFGSFAGLNIRHDADVNLTVEDITSKFRIEANNIVDKVQEWSEIEMPRPMQLEYAREAAHIRWGDKYAGNLDTLLIPYRKEDSKDTVWNTYNRLQEKVIKGGERFNGNRRSRHITNIDAIRTVNTELWDLTDKYAAALTA